MQVLPKLKVLPKHPSATVSNLASLTARIARSAQLEAECLVPPAKDASENIQSTKAMVLVLTPSPFMNYSLRPVQN